MKQLIFAGTALACLAFASCTLEPDAKENHARDGHAVSFSLVNWNTQTFFDGETSGAEYDDFKGAKSSWSRDKYKIRLARLCEAIAMFDADIVALEEIENDAVVRDITNELNGRMAQNRLYPYACFAAKPGSAIGCAVLSRFSIADVTVHQTDWRSGIDPVAPDMRPIMEVTIMISEKAAPVRLFVNHWKSKSGGEAAAAFWQGKQEAVLARRVIRYPSDAVIACGDFNRTIAEFTQGDGEAKRVELRGESGESASFTSGWLSFPPSHTGDGSYFYQNRWESIDHVFAAGKAALTTFSALKDGPWARESSAGAIPYRYVLSSGEGYSDHLPVFAVVDVK
jgi:endonuclease/exonuclease/phosphatase family metal-dependent hydrolase